MQNSKFKLTITVVLAVLFMLSGCADFKQKFIRKPKLEKAPVRHYQVVRTYDVHPSIELYTKRYIFWKNWHSELLAILKNENMKKINIALEQGISNLIDMRNMLVDEKSDEFQKVIDEFAELEQVIKKEKITIGNEVRIRRKLEMLERDVRKFSYTKMQDFIRSEFRHD